MKIPADPWITLKWHFPFIISGFGFPLFMYAAFRGSQYFYFFPLLESTEWHTFLLCQPLGFSRKFFEMFLLSCLDKHPTFQLLVPKLISFGGSFKEYHSGWKAKRKGAWMMMVLVWTNNQHRLITRHPLAFLHSAPASTRPLGMRRGRTEDLGNRQQIWWHVLVQEASMKEGVRRSGSITAHMICMLKAPA